MVGFWETHEIKMSRYDFNAPRLFVDAPFAVDAKIALDRDQGNYLANVLRLRSGDSVLVFNGRDGEWRGELVIEGRKSVDLVIRDQQRAQTTASGIIYMFAPIKHARLDYMVQKAVEMGVGALQPVFTQRTQAGRVNLERMRANAIEAAEQCGILTIPEILPDTKLAPALQALASDCLMIFCDEAAPVADPVAALQAVQGHKGGFALIIGPEGGFTDTERAQISARQPVLRLSLGPRILRADTAGVAALAVIQAVVGDWGGCADKE